MLATTIELIEMFHAQLSLKEIEKRTGVDQRKIRSAWRRTFGKAAVRQRGIRMRQKASAASCRKNIGHDAFVTAIKSCPTIAEAAERLGVSKGYVHQRASNEGVATVVNKLGHF